MLIYTSRCSCKPLSKRTSSKTPIAQVHKISSLTSSSKSTFTSSYTIPSSLTAFSLSPKINFFLAARNAGPSLSVPVSQVTLEYIWKSYVIEGIYIEWFWLQLYRALEFAAVNPGHWGRKYRFAYGLGFPTGYLVTLVVHSFQDATCSSIGTSNILYVCFESGLPKEKFWISCQAKKWSWLPWPWSP